MATRPVPRAVKLTGTTESTRKTRLLKAGNFSVLFDNGSLRNISYKGVEVLRGIFYLVRNVSWGTCNADVKNLRIRQTSGSFNIAYTAVCKDNDQELHFAVVIDADVTGLLRFHATAHPQTDFITNRTGFVVLHPLEGVAGRAVSVVHTDGKKQKTKFPKLVSPGQPIFWIRSLAHEVMPGVTATVTMEGDAFEMEDQRNWTDASYKTYVHSLLEPWPYTLLQNQSYAQSVTLMISGQAKTRSHTRAGHAIEVAIGIPSARMPAIGTAVSMAQAEPAHEAQEHLEAAQLSNLVCQLGGHANDLTDTAQAYASLSERTKIPVKLELILPAQAPAMEEMAHLADIARRAGLQPSAVVVTHAHDLRSFQPGQERPWGPSYEEMATAARHAFPRMPIGGGMLSYFTELNRKPVPKGVFDFVTHTVCPIVHAADDLSVMETLEALPWIFASTRAMMGRTPYHLGPSGISARDNPYGTALAKNPDNMRVCLAGNDPREKGIFAAAWTLGLVAAAARGQLESVALSAATGPNGLVNEDGTLTPAYHVVAGLAAARGKRHLSTTSTAPSKIAALSHHTANGVVLWVANLTADEQTVSVKGARGTRVLHEISTRTFSKIARDPHFLASAGETFAAARHFTLPPYAVFRLSGA